MKKIYTIGSLGLLVAASLSGCSTTQPLSFDGTMSVPAYASNLEEYGPTQAGDNCFIPEDIAYSDIGPGTQVTLRDSTGATIGLSNLGFGSLANGWTADGESVYKYSTDFMWDKCVYSFTFSDVETSDDFFSIEVGNRGEVQFSRDQLETLGAGLELGRN